MATFKPIDARRDNFRKYLETTGAMELLTKILARLIDDQNPPEDAIGFIRENMGDTRQERVHITLLEEQLAAAKTEIAELRSTIDQMQSNTPAILPNLSNTVPSVEAVKEESGATAQPIVEAATSVEVAADVGAETSVAVSGPVAGNADVGKEPEPDLKEVAAATAVAAVAVAAAPAPAPAAATVPVSIPEVATSASDVPAKVVQVKEAETKVTSTEAEPAVVLGDAVNAVDAAKTE